VLLNGRPGDERHRTKKPRITSPKAVTEDGNSADELEDIVKSLLPEQQDWETLTLVGKAQGFPRRSTEVSA
jgi:hypothetical protein